MHACDAVCSLMDLRNLSSMHIRFAWSHTIPSPLPSYLIIDKSSLLFIHPAFSTSQQSMDLSVCPLNRLEMVNSRPSGCSIKQMQAFSSSLHFNRTFSMHASKQAFMINEISNQERVEMNGTLLSFLPSDPISICLLPLSMRDLFAVCMICSLYCSMQAARTRNKSLANIDN